jgi:cardiolipin synthase
MNSANVQSQKRIFTIPNLLSLFRLCLIPIIIWLYSVRQDYLLTILVLLVSGITDVADGIIARRFNMVSELGKALDPVADKLTQIALLFSLVTRFRYMIIPLVILTIKELLAGTLNMLTAKKTGHILGAVWHGKLNTVLVYSMVMIHLIWFDIPVIVSNILIVICTCMMLLSSVLYTIRNVAALTGKKQVSELE